MGPQGLLRLKAAQLQVRIGTHSREPYLALIPDGAVGQPRSPTIVVEAAYLVETEQQLLKSLDLWMSDACDCQVGSALGSSAWACGVLHQQKCRAAEATSEREAAHHT